MFSWFSSLVTRSLGRRLAFGIGVVSIAGLFSTTCAILVVYRTSDYLSTLATEAWEVADGTMEAQILLEKQIIEANLLLSGLGSQSSEKELLALSDEVHEALARATQNAALTTDQINELQGLHQKFTSTMKTLIEAHDARQSRLEEFLTAASKSDELNMIVEEIGDGSVEDLENSPNQEISWANGLSSYWDAADGAMEARIGYLQQIYATQLIVRDSSSSAFALLKEADTFQDDAVAAMKASGLFARTVENNELSGEFTGQPLLIAYERIADRFRQVRDNYIAADSKVDKLLAEYTGLTTKLLNSLSEIEEIADQEAEQLMMNASEDASLGVQISLLFAGAGLLLGLVSGTFTVRSITTAVKAMADRLREIAEGNADLTARLQDNRADELGDLARWYNLFVKRMHSIIHNVKDCAQEISLVSHEVSAASEQVSVGAVHTKDQSSAVAVASEQMSAQISHVAESAEAIAANMNGVSTRVVAMIDIIRDIVTNTDNSTRTVANARDVVIESSERVAELMSAASDIDRIIEAIQDIAEQTNLLALNATIEANRAGEAGRGFAVVATEVKELAKQTSVASDDIRDKIHGIQSTTSAAVASITEIRNVVECVNAIMDSISNAVGEQSVATEEINQFVSNTNNCIESATLTVRESSKVSKEIKCSATQVDEIARTTVDGANRYKHVGSRLSSLSGGLQELVGQFQL